MTKPWTWEALGADLARMPAIDVMRETRPAPLTFEPLAASLMPAESRFERALLPVIELRFSIAAELALISTARLEIRDAIEPPSARRMTALLAEGFRLKEQERDRHDELRETFASDRAVDVRPMLRQANLEREAYQGRLAAYPATPEQAAKLADLDRAEAETRASERLSLVVDPVTRIIRAHPFVASTYRREQIERYIEQSV